MKKQAEGNCLCYILNIYFGALKYLWYLIAQSEAIRLC